LNTTETISHIDRHFARMMQRLAGRENTLLVLAAKLVSSQTRAGHICLDLVDLTNREFLTESLGDDVTSDFPETAVDDLSAKLRETSVVGKPGDFQPLILDTNNRLYLNRYWQYQETLAQFVLARSTQSNRCIDTGAPRTLLDKYFPEEDDIWQKVAAAIALYKNFCVITGGPGTGKTSTVVKIIALLLEEIPDQRVVLAAPTGKAANRLQESIKFAKENLPCTDEIKAKIPDEAKTIHRLLGAIRHSPRFRHKTGNPLDADVVIVDEASMVPVALMAKLTAALPAHAKLILLGDHNQLASVEAGAVLADICGSGALNVYSSDFKAVLEKATGANLELCESPAPSIQDCIVQLRHNYRFGGKSGIMALSEAVNRGDVDLALEILQDDQYDDVHWHAADSNVLSTILGNFGDYGSSGSPADIFDRFKQFRVLCAVREGPQGIRVVNSKIEQFVRRKLVAKPDDRWYAGQPVLVSENDYDLNLFNGDVGIILRDADGNLMTFFQDHDRGFRKISPFRLPQFELAYAVTVHKSQGTEFEKVLLLLPEQDSPVLTRELIYTGITRAAKCVEILASEESLRAAVGRQTKRTSGLGDALWPS